MSVHDGPGAGSRLNHETWRRFGRSLRTPHAEAARVVKSEFKPSCNAQKYSQCRTQAGRGLPEPCSLKGVRPSPPRCNGGYS
jgi:hypothetical protein